MCQLNEHVDRQKEVFCIKSKKKGLSNSESRYITREAIRGALFILMKTEKINKIKIVDLVKKAGVSSAAFYRNYESVEEVLIESIELEVNKIIDELTTDLSTNWRKIIAIFRKNKYYLDLLNKTNNLYIVLDCFNKQFSNDNYYLLGWNGFIYNILVTWIKNGMVENDEEFYRIVKDCTKKMAVAIESNTA